MSMGNGREILLKRKFVNYCVYVFALMVAALFSSFILGEVTQNNIDTAERILGVLALLSIIGFLYVSKKFTGNILSVATMFVIFLYLFNLGIPIARLLGWVDESVISLMNRKVYVMGYDTTVEFYHYGFYIISVLQIGISYFWSKKEIDYDLMSQSRQNDFDNEWYEKELKVCVLMGKILMAIGLIPYIYEEYTYLKDALLYGYQNTESTYSLAGTGIGLISGLFTVGITMLLVGYQKNRKVFDWILVLAIVYQLIRMFISGDRSTGLVLILIWLLIRQRYVYRIRGKKTIFILVAIYIAMIFLKLVEMTRSITAPSASEVIGELFQSNMLAETITDYGNNVWSGLMVYYSVPSTGSFRYGLTYIAAIIGKPLSILNITDKVWEFADFSVFLNDSARGSVIASVVDAMGGSFIGEWYFNFGWVGIILVVFFGYFLAKFSDACENRENNPVVSGYLLYVATLVVWWTRQYATSVTWYAMVYGIGIWILYRIITKDRKGRSVRNAWSNQDSSNEC